MSRLRIIGSIVAKDLRAFTRDKFFVAVTILGLVFYVGIFWVLPDKVDETAQIGVHAEGLEAVLVGLGEGEGLELVPFGHSDSLANAVETGEGDIVAGIDFPDRFLEMMLAGERTTVRVFVRADVPPQFRTAVNAMVKEVAFNLAGEPLPVTPPAAEEIILGEDRAGNQVSFQEKSRPMFAFFVLLIETFALASLVAAEVQDRTVTAVLVTPARTGDFLAAKGIVGTAVAFGEAALLMVAIRSFDQNPGLLAVALALGAVLVTGFGLIAGSTGKDFIGIIFWSLLFLIPLAIPAFGVLFPGTASAWVKALPTYGLVETIVGATGYGITWAEALPHLGTLAAWCAVVFAVGWLTLRRKVEAL